MRRLTALALPALVLVAGCGSGLDTTKTEQAIEGEIKEATGANAVNVDCPDDVDQKKDENFTCSATVEGEKINVPVVQRDDDGNISYSPEIVATTEVEEMAERQVNAQLEITTGGRADCPTVVPLERGGTFTCEVETPGPNFEATVTQTDDKGRIRVGVKRTSGG